MLNRLVRWSRIKSPWILHLNSGACNACDIEVVAALTPRFDVERFGVLLKATPRHADVLIATGPVTRQIKDRIIRIYDQTPDPKFVIAVGACAMSGCVYRGAYNIMGGLDQVIPVNVYVPGCPPRPEQIIDGFLRIQDLVAAEPLRRRYSPEYREILAGYGIVK